MGLKDWELRNITGDVPWNNQVPNTELLRQASSNESTHGINDRFNTSNVNVSGGIDQNIGANRLLIKVYTFTIHISVERVSWGKVKTQTNQNTLSASEG
jgi:hypothetical protein